MIAATAMNDVIKEVIKTEGDAKRLVEGARAEADRIASEAQEQARRHEARVRQETKDEAESLLQTAMTEAQRDKQELVARAVEEIRTRLCLDDATKQLVAEGAVRCVCASGQRKVE